MGTKEISGSELVFKTDYANTIAEKTVIDEIGLDNGVQVITEETIEHPTAGTLTKEYIYTFDATGAMINKEYYVQPPEDHSLLDAFKKASPEDIAEIKKALGI